MVRAYAAAMATTAVLWSLPSHSESALFILTTDFETGSTAFLASQTATAETELLTVHSDAIARYHKGLIYVVNRLGQDNVLVLAESELDRPLKQFSVGNGTNPHDIAIVSPEKAYVSLYADTRLLVVNPQEGTILEEIDLSGFADDDGTPEMSQMAIVGNRLYVACQRLNRDGFFEPVAPSYLAVVDIDSDTLVDMDPNRDGIQGWQLTATNPANVSALGGKLYVALTGGFGDLEGGIEVLDPQNGTSYGLVVSETDIGGDLTWLSVASPAKGFAVFSDENFENHIRPVDLGSGQVAPALAGHSGGFIPATAVDGDRLIVPDRGSFERPQDVGLLFYDVETHVLTAGPIAVGLPPAWVVPLADDPLPTAVEGSGSSSVPGRSVLDVIYPNPFNSSTIIAFSVGTHQRETVLSVYDILGQRLRHLLPSGAQPLAGRHLVRWDGRDDGGRRLSSGTYIVELRDIASSVRRKVTLLK